MPLPPEEVENGENSANEEPKLQFSYVECLLFSFHQLGKKLPDFLLDKVDAERLKDFKIRWESDAQECLLNAISKSWKQSGILEPVGHVWLFSYKKKVPFGRFIPNFSVFEQVTVFRQRPAGLHQTAASSTARQDGRRSEDRRGNEYLQLKFDQLRKRRQKSNWAAEVVLCSESSAGKYL